MEEVRRLLSNALRGLPLVTQYEATPHVPTKSFQNLQKIASDTAFPKHVKFIFYETALVHFLINREWFELHASTDMPRRQGWPMGFDCSEHEGEWVTRRLQWESQQE